MAANGPATALFGHLAVNVEPAAGDVVRDPKQAQRRPHIVGMEDKDALALVEDLMRHATQKKYEYRHKWRHGDWVLWDNRSLMHQANPDYDMSERRYLYRLMLQGEAPV